MSTDSAFAGRYHTADNKPSSSSNAARKKTQSVWPLESLSLKEHVLQVNSRKKWRPRLLSLLQTTKRNNTPHHLILLQQKKIAAPLPSPNGFWLSALALHLWGFITNVKSSRSGPRSYYSAKKKNA